MNMNKLMMPVMALAFVSVTACQSSKNALTVASLEGEWNIVEVNGTSVDDKEQSPYIGFDTKEGRVYGNSGCNQMMGSFDVKSKPGKITLGQMAGTMMMCPDMETEKNILNALEQVKEYKSFGKNEIALCSNSKHPLLVLKKRFFDMSIDELKGEWKIVKVFGQPVSEDAETKPFLNFDVDGRKVSGNASCNTINGNFTTDASRKQSIAFTQMASTRMMCQHMDTERNILNALENTKSFAKLENGHLALYDNGVQVMELAR